MMAPMERGWDEIERGDRDRETGYENGGLVRIGRAETISISRLYLQSWPGKIERGDREIGYEDGGLTGIGRSEAISISRLYL
jgi:hypothetical protein